ncbi:glycosyltransferase family protein [Flavobacterium ajazii]|uniref:hypothetical protein n=1 Tax=Flavobacterium ajazii TaxID=2692318 RepID=UPI0013D6680A|nr:hypothetical protein [Flavobacterium ajazii]
MNQKNICSIICCYYPDDKIIKNQLEILTRISDVFIFDNSSSLILEDFINYDSVVIKKSISNLGTLKAYNEIISANSNYEYYWLWDQDTVITYEIAKEFIEASFKCFKESNNIVATTFLDKKNKINPLNKDKILIKASTTFLMKSKVESYVPLVFDENLFMDYGDWDFAYRLTAIGGYIQQIETPKYNHSFGDTNLTWLGKFNISSQIRIYMQGLNTIYLIRKNGLFNFLSIILIMRFFYFPVKCIFLGIARVNVYKFFLGIFDGLRGVESFMFMTNKMK